MAEAEPTAPAPPAPRDAERARRHRAIALRVAVAVVVAIGLLFVVVYPLQAWSDQRDEISASQRRVEVLRKERLRLEARARELRKPATVEQIARDRYGMVRPGEQAWAVVPGPTTTSTTLPQAP